MTDRERQLRDAFAQIHDRWEESRSERGLPRVRKRFQAARRRRALAYLAAGAGAIALGFAVWPRVSGPELAAAPASSTQAGEALRGHAGAPAPLAASDSTGHAADPASSGLPASAVQSRRMQFADGSRLELLDRTARIVVDEVTRQRMSLRLLTGRVRVDVVPRKERAFWVQCGDVSVEVLGTAFELSREAARTHVTVLRGRVTVHWPDGSSQLGAGEAGWFPRSSVRPERARAVEASARALGADSVRTREASARTLGADSERTHEASARALITDPARARDASVRAASASPQPATSAPDVTWQAQAERGDYQRAYALMPRAPEHIADDVQELLLAADAARLSGHPAEALPFLRQVIERHPRDARASLAAFTLGNLLLNQLDRPREAEAAYARARGLALSPALAQDALARQVEAAQRADDLPRTRALAEEYVRRYPDGRRIQWVRQLGGL